MEGHSTIKKLQQLETHKKGHKFAYFFKEPVSIMWARIVEKQDKKKKDEGVDKDAQKKPQEAQKKQQAAQNAQRNNAAQQVPASNAKPKPQGMKNEVKGNQAQAQPKAQMAMSN